MNSHLDDVDLLEPWQRCPKGLEAQLAKELPAGHVLFGVNAESVARRIDNDDVLFYLPNNDPQYAVVHLTWSQGSASDAKYPWTVFFSSVPEWIENCMRPDHDEFKGRQ